MTSYPHAIPQIGYFIISQKNIQSYYHLAIMVDDDLRIKKIEYVPKHNYEQRIETVMVSNSTNISITNNHLSP